MHEAMTYFTKYSYNFCQPVRTLLERADLGRWQRRTPAMAAGLADHVWSLKEWLTLPAVQQLIKSRATRASYGLRNDSPVLLP
jgi:hypothetical protein